MGRQHQEDEDDGDKEHPHRGVAGLQLQKREFGPLGAHRQRQIIVGVVLRWAIAWPELTPGPASPCTAADRYML